MSLRSLAWFGLLTLTLAAPVIVRTPKETPAPDVVYDARRTTPDSPYRASYLLDGEEVTLDGVGDGTSDQRYKSTGDVEYGDLNADGVPDAVLVIRNDTLQNGQFYLAAALAGSDGYVGMEGLRLPGQIAPQAISIIRGLVHITYPNNQASSTEPLVYASLIGTRLTAVTLRDKEVLLFGTLHEVDDAIRLTSCDGTVYLIIAEQGSIAAVRAIYSERQVVSVIDPFVVVVGLLDTAIPGEPIPFRVYRVVSAPIGPDARCDTIQSDALTATTTVLE